jgi:hypothetical protein
LSRLAVHGEALWLGVDEWVVVGSSQYHQDCLVSCNAPAVQDQVRDNVPARVVDGGVVPCNLGDKG